MVKGHYEKLGFQPLGQNGSAGTVWRLELENYVPTETSITIREG
jgi:hypothetical protein